MRGARVVKICDCSGTGGKHEVMPSLLRRVGAITRSDRNVKRVYVGIASGSESIKALKLRYDKYKRENGINEIHAVYSSSSQENVRAVETALIDHLDEADVKLKLLNRRRGGGGAASSADRFWVYLAIRRWG